MFRCLCKVVRFIEMSVWAGNTLEYCGRSKTSSKVRDSLIAPIYTYKQFLKIRIQDTDVTDVLKVVDAQGNEYFKVNTWVKFSFDEILMKTDAFTLFRISFLKTSVWSLEIFLVPKFKYLK